MHEGENKSENDTLFLACSVETITHNEVRHIDNGCSNHITGNNKMFMDLDESVTSEVRTGDDKRLFVKRKGNILVQIKKGAKYIFSVFNILGLKHNLSVG